MDYSRSLTDLIARARRVAREVEAQRAGREDVEGSWPEEGMRALQEEGLMGLQVPVELGGHGLGMEALVAITQELSRESPSLGLCFAMHCVGTACIAAKATEEQKARYLVPIAEGRHITTLALSEPGTGAHFYFPETRLERDGDGYRITGTKSGEAKREEYLQRSQKAAAHLLALLNDVLDLSKLESGMIEVQRERTRIQEVVHDLVSTLEPLAHERGSSLEVDCDPDAGEIETDARRLSQILINLSSNAVKFGEGRPICLRCRRTAEELVFEVEDQGPGIEPSQLDRIFEEFVQVSDSDEGTGLGLPISRKLAELLGGTLTVESEPGEGSVFRLRLPLDPDRELAPISRPERTGAPPRNPG